MSRIVQSFAFLLLSFFAVTATFLWVYTYKYDKMFAPLYPNYLKNWFFGCAKASGIDDRKSVHISNIDRLTIVDSRELSRGPKTNFSGNLGIGKVKILNTILQKVFFIVFLCAAQIGSSVETGISEGLPLYYWQQPNFVNFGDYLSPKLVERIVGQPVRIFRRHPKNKDKKLLAIGSLISFAANDDVIWGTGINGKLLKKESYNFDRLDVRAVRGPLTRQFLYDNFQINCPEIYGDPALLIPHFFPEFQKQNFPSRDFILILHYSEEKLFPKSEYPYVVYSTDHWEEIIRTILDSKFVVSTTLHGIIVAEAFGIPARLLRLTETEPLFKYQDYYCGTGRPHFQFATSLEEALSMGGEPPFQCDLEKLYDAFPFEFWPNSTFKHQ